MRITNSIMLNTQKSNINGNKILMDTLHTQMSTQKKIAKPSDDPIIAVRALRLRANLAEITQYADRNVEDGLSWMEITEASMNNMRDILDDMYGNYTQGNNTYLGTAPTYAILESLESLCKEFYGEGNSSCAGRTLFTGYKTTSEFLYKKADPDAKFTINENFKVSQIKGRDFISTPDDIKTIDKGNLNTIIDRQDFPEVHEVSTFNLTYTGVDELTEVTCGGLTFSEANGLLVNTSLARDGDEAYTSTKAGGINEDKIVYIKETGELVFGQKVMEQLSQMGSDTELVAKYDKEGFLENDINPVMYFDCVDNVNNITYTKEKQDIEYNVGFNQKIKVNSEGSDVLPLDVKKEIASLRDAVTAVDNAEKRKADIEDMLESSLYNDQQKEVLKSMLDAVNKEIDLKQNRVVKLMTKGVGSMQGYKDHVTAQISDLGNRYSQLTMIKQRMQQQKTNFKELMTQNEDRELSDILLDYTASTYSYQLALQATGNISKLSLLNYV